MEKILLDNDILDTYSTNFYFVHHKQLLIIEDSYDISMNTALRFFYHACERYIGGNFEIKTEFQQNINEILANTSIKNVKVRIERPNPISPDDIEIVRDLFTASNSTHISRKDLLKYDFDNLPESMDERASWILENFEMLGV